MIHVSKIPYEHQELTKVYLFSYSVTRLHSDRVKSFRTSSRQKSGNRKAESLWPKCIKSYPQRTIHFKQNIVLTKYNQSILKHLIRWQILRCILPQFKPFKEEKKKKSAIQTPNFFYSGKHFYKMYKCMSSYYT